MPQSSGGASKTAYSEYSGSQKPMSRLAVSKVASDAVKQLGVPQSWVAPLVQLAEKESSFRPGIKAEQGAYYSPEWGTQYAVGLMQVMPPTFAQYADAGYDDITNPLHNMMASIKYIKANYGDPFKVLQKWASQGGY